MIVTTAELFKVAYGKFVVGAYNIAHKSQKRPSVGRPETGRAASLEKGA